MAIRRLILLLLAGSAVAAARADETELQTIMVTARRTLEDLMSVPTSVAALDRSALASLNVNQLDDFSRLVPGFSTPDSGPAGVQGEQPFVIRGIAGAGGPASVAQYIDEIPIGRENPLMGDLDRLEILRGPQGTLYGVNALAGVVKYVRANPELDRDSGWWQAAGVTLGDARYGYSAGGAVNERLIDDALAIRVSALVRSEPGFIGAVDPRNAGFTDRDVNSSLAENARAALHYHGGDLDLVMNWQEDVQRINAFQYANPGYVHLTQERQTPEYEQRRFRLADAVLRYELPAGELVWVSGYSESPRTDQYDVTGVVTDFIPSAPPLPEHDRSSIDSFTQELRLAGHSPQLSYTGGAFYRRTRNRLEQEIRAPGLGDASLVDLGTDLGDDFASGVTRDVTTDYALYGDVRWQVAQGWSLDSGVRIYRTEDEFSTALDGFGNGGAFMDHGRGVTDGAAPRVTLAYDMSTAAMAYLSVGKGYRQGGANGYVPADVCAADLNVLGRTTAPSHYASDTLWSYELGTKINALDQRIELSAAVYDIEWRGLIQLVNLPTCGFSYLTNASRARSRGFEFEPRAKLTSELLVSAALGYVDPTFVDDAPNVGAVRGDRVQDSWDWSASVRVDYRKQLGDGNVSAHADWQYTGSGSFGYDFDDPAANRKSPYSISNVSVAYLRRGYELQVALDNVTDAQPVTQALRFLGALQQYTVRPRSLQLSIRHRW